MGYTDLTDEIGAKVRDIYNLQNYTDCCYAVDEEQNIYYVSVEWGDEIAVNKITQFELGTRKIDTLDGSYKNAVLLMEGDILALGNDGYLYVVKDKN